MSEGNGDPATDSAPEPSPSDPSVEAPRRRRFRLRRRRAKKRRLPFDLRKALFILPNAFTVSSIFCGFYAILQATKPGGGGFELFQASLAIFLAGFFDMADGRVARLTKTQSDFGVQIDSLADAISFGVAPGVLIYRWALMDIGPWGKIVAFTFTACGVIRLARFNVLAARGEGSSVFFIGLPIPVAAAMLVSLVIAQYRTFGVPVQAHQSVVAITLVLSYLMVSNVRYYTFKTFRPSLRTFPLILLGGVAWVAITLLVRLSFTLVVFIGGYVFIGLASEVLLYKKRRAADDAARPDEDGENSGPHAAAGVP